MNKPLPAEAGRIGRVPQGGAGRLLGTFVALMLLLCAGAVGKGTAD